MTMHLVQGMSSVSTKKPKQKHLTKAKLAQLTKDHQAFNKKMRQEHRHREQLSFDEYVDKVYGRKSSTKKEFKELKSSKPDYRKTPYNPVNTRSTSIAAKKEPKKYTGTLVKGISQTHKSNAVPVISNEEIIDISNMRRN